ncbi:7-alpha-hydroxysteroid dehydrogenase [Fusarium albosuccineum]|uniref:7-alpha-hydroxysteroid dehydrogenase n=1 Tax=Fusarium albosuccineum TaxID=1237068 RepID=A0A8H4LAU3_9HYPO|nr:7-alpha-hydroxysteroid dehydrogenase [Fusarium albosuccineum]
MASKSFYALVAGVGPGTGKLTHPHLTRDPPLIAPLGRATALRFAQKYPVVLLARRPESYEQTVADVKKAGGQAVGITADVADPSSLKKAFESIGKELPGSKLAAAVYNVNGGFARKPFLELTVEDLDGSIDGTIRAFFHFAQATLPLLQEAVPDSPYPPTIIITGAAASVKGSAQFGSFAAGKWALRALGQSLAREFGPKGIHVAHAVIDGVIDIPRTKGWSVNNDAEDGKIKPEAEVDIRPYVEKF